jgi:cytochrome P450
VLRRTVLPDPGRCAIFPPAEILSHQPSAGEVPWPGLLPRAGEQARRVRLPADPGAPPALLLLSHQAVTAALQLGQVHDVPMPYCTTGGGLRGDDFIHLDPPRHTSIRRVIGPVLADTSPTLRRAHRNIARRLARWLDFGAGPVDLIEHYCRPLVDDMACAETGIPASAWPGVVAAGNAALALIDRPGAETGALAGLADLAGYCRDIAAGRLGGGVLAAAVSAMAEAGHDEAATIGALRTMLTGYATTVLPVLAVTLHKLLTSRRRCWPVFVAAPQLRPAILAEILRLDAHFPTATTRLLARPAFLAGLTIPAGVPLVSSVTAALRDPAVFADPGRFDITRPPPKPGHDLVFGARPHACPARGKAYGWLEIAVGELAAAHPGLELAAQPDLAPGLLTAPASLYARAPR